MNEPTQQRHWIYIDLYDLPEPDAPRDEPGEPSGEERARTPERCGRRSAGGGGVRD